MLTSIQINHRNGKTSLDLAQGDITQQSVGAIVNAANAALRGGGGVDGAIHRAGGPQIMEECRSIGGCPTGGAVITTAGELAAKYVIHAVGPIYRGGQAGEAELLARAYQNALQRALEKELKSMAFPSLSTGAYGYPLGEASQMTLAAVQEWIQTSVHRLETVRFVLFDQSTFEAYQKALSGLVQR